MSNNNYIELPEGVNSPVLCKGDCAELLARIPDSSIDAIITDPPYLYLNTRHEVSSFDKPFDERSVFYHYKRILKKTGFLLFFGRGRAFYRWNTIVDSLGFIFKEEIIWNKPKPSSPFLKLGRKHETIAVYGASKASHVRACYFPYKEELDNISVEDAIANIEKNIAHIKQGLKREDILKDIELYLDTGVQRFHLPRGKGSGITITASAQHLTYRSIESLRMIQEGRKETDVINITPDIIEMKSDVPPYHPTQKPTRLMERLISIVTDAGDVVLDSFMGSGTTGVACINQGRRFVGMEVDDAYFATAEKRTEEAIDANKKEPSLF